MSVIVSRALPDARDGLKPVHRRILYAMQVGGYTADKPYRKSAKVVGEVMGNFHPHGDSAIYDALVRMAQPFSMRVPLVDGQGNFGSIDGDPPAAMRYTEIRLAKAATFLLQDFDKDTVDFQPTYDESDKEPRVLPAQYPNLLVNGANGIAVGMATNIPPHNPTEIIDAVLHLIEHPEATLDELMTIVPGPDFPTGGMILGRGGDTVGVRGGPGQPGGAGEGRVRGDAGKPDGDHRHRNSVSGEQDDAAGEDRRADPLEDGRGHQRHARRERPRWDADRDGAEARCGRRRWC